MPSNGMNGTPVSVNGMLHLKSGINYIERNTLLITGKYLSDPTTKTNCAISSWKDDPRRRHPAFPASLMP
jgi:hypothetical protein